jgi:flagellar basal-body rod protein FlgG
MYAAATGMISHQLALDVTADNLANVNTTAFKRTEVNFSDLFPVGPDQAQIGNGVRPASVSRVFTGGAPEITDNPLDLFIDGQGFFRVLLPNGESAYTRDGAFNLDASGRLVTAAGFVLQPSITIPPDTISITVAPDGTVSVLTAASPITPTILGQIEITRFVNPAGLVGWGDNLFTESPNSGEPLTGTPGTEARGTLLQGAVERSNVEVVDEFVRLITAQRAFVFNARAFQTTDEMVQTANALVRLG